MNGTLKTEPLDTRAVNETQKSQGHAVHGYQISFYSSAGVALACLLLYWQIRNSTIPMTQTFSFDQYGDDISTENFTGEARLNKSSKTISHQLNFLSRGAQLHLIIQFPVLNTSGGQSNSELVKRQEEFIYCLQRNLLSPHVMEIHILCESDQDPLYIQALNLSLDWKLVFHFLGRRMRYRDAFEYASHNLLRKNAMIINADCYVDKGFEYLDENILSNKTMYALTRHETEENVRLCNVTDFCGTNAKYRNSHDAFLFRLLAPVSSEFVSKIDYRPNIMGIESVIMFNSRKYAGFTVKNPCKILHIVHHHCSRKRNKEERRIHGQRVDHYLNITTIHNRGEVVKARFSGL